jgi:hypothetical protein
MKNMRSSFSRREFMTTAVGAGGAMLIGPPWLHAAADARDRFLRWLTAVDADLEKGHIRRALTLKDLQSAHTHGQPTIVQTVKDRNSSRGRCCARVSRPAISAKSGVETSAVSLARSRLATPKRISRKS